jgi:hypothetical protein
MTENIFLNEIITDRESGRDNPIKNPSPQDDS